VDVTFIEVGGHHIRDHAVVISYHDPCGSAVLSYALVTAERRGMSANRATRCYSMGHHAPAVVGGIFGHDSAQSLRRVRQSRTGAT
jgi:hypothetical protein